MVKCSVTIASLLTQAVVKAYPSSELIVKMWCATKQAQLVEHHLIQGLWDWFKFQNFSVTVGPQTLHLKVFCSSEELRQLWRTGYYRLDYTQECWLGDVTEKYDEPGVKPRKSKQTKSGKKKLQWTRIQIDQYASLHLLCTLSKCRS